MSRPVIDVVIPLFNVESFIGHTLRSVLAQTLPPRQVIVVDDGSSDNGAEVVRSIQRTHPGPTRIVLLQRTNGGLSSARNHGIAHSDAPFIAFLDADDLWAAEKLEAQYALFERDRDGTLALVYCLTHDIDAEGRDLKTEATHHAPLRGDVFDRLLLANRITGSASAVLLRRAHLDKAGPFDTSLTALEDLDLWLRICRIGQVDLVERDLVALRRHDRNMQKSTDHMLRNMLVFYRKWFPDAQRRAEVMKEWGHLIGEFVLRSSAPAHWARAVETTFNTEQRQLLFRRTFGSLRLYLLLKRARKRLLRDR